MTVSAKPVGRLLLMPNTLDLGAAEVPLTDVLANGIIATASRLLHWVVEDSRSARAFLNRVNKIAPLAQPLQQTLIEELPRAPKGAQRMIPGKPGARAGQARGGPRLGLGAAARARRWRPRHRPAERGRPARRGRPRRAAGGRGPRPGHPGRRAERPELDHAGHRRQRAQRPELRVPRLPAERGQPAPRPPARAGGHVQAAAADAGVHRDALPQRRDAGDRAGGAAADDAPGHQLRPDAGRRLVAVQDGGAVEGREVRRCPIACRRCSACWGERQNAVESTAPWGTSTSW